MQNDAASVLAVNFANFQPQFTSKSKFCFFLNYENKSIN